ncbi:MAG TPA: hypothetical protein VHJ17_17140 [Thermomonospora sp.]|nr:hypothetical protein [Thermomonospora sp.]
MSAVTLLLVTLLSPVGAAAEPYDPAPWTPLEGHNVSTVRWGPITIPAAPEHPDPGDPHGGHGHGPAGELRNEIAIDGGKCSPFVKSYTSCREMTIAKPCEDCYITGVLPDLVIAGTDTSVNVETGGMLHHVVNMNLKRTDPMCRPGPGGLINLLGLFQGGNQRWFAAGNERTYGAIHSSGQYGYRVNAGDKWGLIYHLMNLRKEPLTVEFKYTFTWVKAAKNADPYWLDFDQCGDSERKIPAGYTDIEYDARLWRRGTLLKVGGHAHDGAIAVSLENTTSKAWYCTSVAGYPAGSTHGPAGPGPGTPGHPVAPNTVTRTGHPDAHLDQYHGTVANFTTCEPNQPLGFFDTLRMHTTHYMKEDDPGGMGIMVAYVG